MIILDTDHLTILQHANSKAAEELAAKLALSRDVIATTIISAEEQMRGWLSAIHGKSSIVSQLPYYERLQQMLMFYAKWRVLPVDADAAAIFNDLRKRKLRLKTMDTKIAAIALRHTATLLSANMRDFRQVPKLQVEDWLHG